MMLLFCTPFTQRKTEIVSFLCIVLLIYPIYLVEAFNYPTSFSTILPASIKPKIKYKNNNDDGEEGIIDNQSYPINSTSTKNPLLVLIDPISFAGSIISQTLSYDDVNNPIHVADYNNNNESSDYCENYNVKNTTNGDDVIKSASQNLRFWWPTILLGTTTVVAMAITATSTSSIFSSTVAAQAQRSTSTSLTTISPFLYNYMAPFLSSMSSYLNMATKTLSIPTILKMGQGKLKQIVMDLFTFFLSSKRIFPKAFALIEQTIKLEIWRNTWLFTYRNLRRGIKYLSSLEYIEEEDDDEQTSSSTIIARTVGKTVNTGIRGIGKGLQFVSTQLTTLKKSSYVGEVIVRTLRIRVEKYVKKHVNGFTSSIFDDFVTATINDIDREATDSNKAGGEVTIDVMMNDNEMEDDESSKG